MAIISNVKSDIDFELVYGQNFVLDSSNDLKRVSGNQSVVYGLIRRILAVRGTWAANTDFGSDIKMLLTTKGVNNITESDLRTSIEEVALSMIEDQRLKEIKEVSIKERTSKGIHIKIVVIVEDEPIETNFIIPS